MMVFGNRKLRRIFSPIREKKKQEAGHNSILRSSYILPRFFGRKNQRYKIGYACGIRMNGKNCMIVIGKRGENMDLVLRIILNYFLNK